MGIQFNSNTIKINGTVYVRVPAQDVQKHGIDENQSWQVELTRLVPESD